MISDLQKPPGGPLRCFCGAKVKRKEDCNTSHYTKPGAFKVCCPAIIPEGSDSETREQKQTDDCETGEGIIDMINSVEKRDAKDKPGRNDSENKGQRQKRCNT